VIEPSFYPFPVVKTSAQARRGQEGNAQVDDNSVGIIDSAICGAA
jgi:hypothetical protein